MKNLLNKLGIVILLLIAAVSGGFLFFEDRISSYTDLLGFKDNGKKIDNQGEVLKIAYLFQPKDLNPYSGDTEATTRLNNVYEPLVQVDQDLNIRPALAISFGLNDQAVWEFVLRKNVKFQDGKLLDLDDVIYSFEQAKNSKDASLNELFANLKKYQKVGLDTIRIETIKADPLLLNKLTKLSIIENNFKNFSQPIGTGPYQVTDASNLAKIIYQRFDQYWGELPYYQQIQEVSLPAKSQRVEALVNGDIDFLVNVPPDSVKPIKEAGLQVAAMPSLEVGFVMFNLKDKQLKNKNIRIAIAQALNKESFLDLAKGFAKTVNQFVSNGVFGYNPELKGIAFNSKASAETISKTISSFEKLPMKFYYPENLKLLGQYFKEQLAQINIDLDLIALNDQELQKKLQKGELSFYYLGWRSDSGDALPFLKSVIHSKSKDSGIYNGNNYQNKEVDSLIEKIEGDLNQPERLQDMQKVMKIIIEDDVIGVPLFETQSLFAYNKNLLFKARVDSLIYPASISKINKNK